MLRLAGLRIDPQTNGLHNTIFNASLTLRKIPEGTEIKVDLPPDPKLGDNPLEPQWRPLRVYQYHRELHRLVDRRHGHRQDPQGRGRPHQQRDGRRRPRRRRRTRRLRRRSSGPSDVQWMPDSKSLLVEITKPNRGAPPAEPLVPTGPHVQESLGGASGSATLEDMLQNPHDEDLFEYYATSQLALVDAATGKLTPVGKPGIIESVRISPNGKNFLVTTVHRPFSYLLGRAIVSQRNRSLGQSRKGRAQGCQPALAGARLADGRSHRPAFHRVEAIRPRHADLGGGAGQGQSAKRSALSRSHHGPQGAVHRRAAGGLQDRAALPGNGVLRKRKHGADRRLRAPEALAADIPGRSRQTLRSATDLGAQQSGSLQRSRPPLTRTPWRPAGWRQHFPYRPGVVTHRRPSFPRSLQPRDPERPSISSAATTITTKSWKEFSTRKATSS